MSCISATKQKSAVPFLKNEELYFEFSTWTFGSNNPATTVYPVDKEKSRTWKMGYIHGDAAAQRTDCRPR